MVGCVVINRHQRADKLLFPHAITIIVFCACKREEKKSAESDFDSAFSMIVSGVIGCAFNAPRAAEDGIHTTYRTLVELD